MRRAGPTVKSGGSYTKDTIFTITYDNRYVRYYVNGILKHTEATSANRTFFAYMSIHDANEWTVSNWSFDPMGSRGSDGIKGPQGNSITGIKGLKGPQGNSVKGQKGELGTSGSPWSGGTFVGDVHFSKKLTGTNPTFAGTVINTDWGFQTSGNAENSGFTFGKAAGIRIRNIGKDTQYLRFAGNPMGTEHTYGAEAFRINKNNSVMFYKDVFSHKPLKLGTQNTTNEGGRVEFTNPNGTSAFIDQYDHKVPGFRNTFRFHLSGQEMASISEAGLVVVGSCSIEQDFVVTGRLGGSLSRADSSSVAFFQDQTQKTNHNRGFALVDKTNTVRFIGYGHNNRHNASAPESRNVYRDWSEILLPTLSSWNFYTNPVVNVHLMRCSTLVMLKNGDVYGAGRNYYGQLGTKSLSGAELFKTGSESSYMAKVNHDKPITKISYETGSSNDNILYLDSDKVLWGAGVNYEGRLLGDCPGVNKPRASYSSDYKNTGLLNSGKQLVKIADNVLDMSMNGWSHHPGIGHSVQHYFGITVLKQGSNGGEIWTRGYNGYGNLGDGTTTNSKLLRQVIDNQFYREDVKSFKTSCDHHTTTTYCLTAKKQLWGWGYNGVHQLGLGHYNNVKEPKLLFDGKTVKRVWCSNGHYTTAFLQDENNEIWACGYAAQGATGTTVTTRDQTTWTKVVGLNADINKNIVDIHLTGGSRDGVYTSVYLHYRDNYGNGQLMVCGRNGYGQLALGHKNQVNQFTRIPWGPRNIKSVMCDDPEGQSHGTLFVTDGDDSLWFAGKNDYYYAEGNSNNHPIFTRVKGLL
jgi:alpha-tubulin suppressor-like RCC1 family protein